MVTVRDDAANEEVLVLGPVRKGDDGWVPEDAMVCFRSEGCLRDVLDDVWKADVARVSVGFHGALEEDIKSGIERW